MIVVIARLTCGELQEVTAVTARLTCKEHLSSARVDLSASVLL